MAWLDERIWCHPKITDLSDRAYRVYVNGLAYSAGFGCKGHLTSGQQRAIGSTNRVRGELIRAALWEDAPGGSIDIHDWDGHNAKREARRSANRDAAARYRNRRVSNPSSNVDDASGDGEVTSG